MSNTFTITGRTSVLSVNYHPPIELDSRYEYALGLIGFHTYHTIANIVEGTNKFYYDKDKVITIPTGAYEIADIEEYLKNALPNEKLSLQPNNQTSQCEIKSSVEIDFANEDSIGRVLGFSEKLLEANKKHTSDLPVNIIKVSMIRVACNITTGAYYNTHLSHTVFEFSPQVDPGYAINIDPSHVIYLPVSSTRIDNITLTLIDQNNEPVDFRGEEIIIRLELKKVL